MRPTRVTRRKAKSRPKHRTPFPAVFLSNKKRDRPPPRTVPFLEKRIARDRLSQSQSRISLTVAQR
jgi:hypothetical protein